LNLSSMTPIFTPIWYYENVIPNPISSPIRNSGDTSNSMLLPGHSTDRIRALGKATARESRRVSRRLYVIGLEGSRVRLQDTIDNDGGFFSRRRRKIVYQGDCSLARNEQ
jgi:hypothetical protein